MTTKLDRPIVVSYWAKPIPLRQFDWCAHFEDEEEAGPYGYGATKEAAVADLLAEVDAYD